MFIDEDIAYVGTTDFHTLVYIPSTIPIQKILNDILIMYVCLGVGNLREFVLFYCVGLENWNHIVRLGNKHFQPLNHSIGL